MTNENEPTEVPSVLKTTASKDLTKEVEAELKKNDPDKATAISVFQDEVVDPDRKLK